MNRRAYRAGATSVAAICFLLAVAACSGSLTPQGLAIVRGPIESISHHATGSGYLVSAGPGSRESCGIAATADARTRYLLRAGSGTYSEITPAGLEVGDTVEVFVEGPVAESCPVQGRASAIVLTGGPADDAP